ANRQHGAQGNHRALEQPTALLYLMLHRSFRHVSPTPMIAPPTTPLGSDPSTTEGTTRHRVGDAEAGERVDRCLAVAFPALSRSRIKALIEQGNLRIVPPASGVAETLDDASYRVKPGEVLELTVPPPEDAVPRGQAIAL